MNYLRKIVRYGLAGVFGGVFALLLATVLLTLPVGRKLVRFSYDFLFSLRGPVPISEVEIVYLDEDSHDKLNQPMEGLWDRALHARLLERLKADGAKAAVFDVVFSDPGADPAKDAEFAAALKSFGGAVLGADFVAAAFNRAGVQGGNQIHPPLELFAESAAMLGTVDVEADPDLVVREHVAYSERDEFVPPLSWAAAAVVGTDLPDTKNRPGPVRYVQYYGPPGHLPSVPYYRVLETNSVEGLAPGFFRNKVVFVGSRIMTKSAGDRKDQYASPFSWFMAREEQHGFIPGVEVQATLFLNMVRQDWLHRIPPIQEFPLIAALALVFGITLTQLRPFFATLAALIGLITIVVLTRMLFLQTQSWFAWAIPAVTLGFAWAWSLVFNSINLFVEKRLMQQSLGMYVSPARVKQIAKNPEMLKPGAEKEELSILFSDIANFTSMSEGMDSDQLAELMNRYFEAAVGKCIHKTEGTVVKFIGDAIFAIWNAPERQKDHQELACHAALLLRNETAAFEGLKVKGDLEVRTRVGLHCGCANVGNFGSSARYDYTAIGESINLASRMEGLNKYLGTDVLITGDIEKAVRDRFVTRYLGQFVLKGFERAVEVFELLDFPARAEQSHAWREAFAKALKNFKRRNFDAAEGGFREVLDLKPNDGPAKYYLKTLESLRAHPPGEDWAGTIELKEK